MKYRLKNSTFDAVLVTRSLIDSPGSWPDWMVEASNTTMSSCPGKWLRVGSLSLSHLSEGVAGLMGNYERPTSVMYGEWIVRDASGTLSCLTGEQFRERYEPLVSSEDILPDDQYVPTDLEPSWEEENGEW